MYSKHAKHNWQYQKGKLMVSEQKVDLPLLSPVQCKIIDIHLLLYIIGLTFVKYIVPRESYFFVKIITICVYREFWEWEFWLLVYYEILFVSIFVLLEFIYIKKLLFLFIQLLRIRQMLLVSVFYSIQLQCVLFFCDIEKWWSNCFFHVVE